MKGLQITKGQLVEVPAQYQAEEGCVAFQMVKVEFDFYGYKYSQNHDTKILACGKQFVINGDGYVKQGFEIN